MNTIISARETTYRYKLLTTVCTAALLAYGTTANAGDDTDRPLIWISVAGELDRNSSNQLDFMPPFAITAVNHGLMSLASLEAIPRYSMGEDGTISFRPKNSNWIFSASIQYGRSNADRHEHQQKSVPPFYFSSFAPSVVPAGPNGYINDIYQTADYGVRIQEQHEIIDFQAGKDVGLGILGRGDGAVSLGVRVARIQTKTSMDLRADPYPHVGYKYFPPQHRNAPLLNYYQFYKARPNTERDFHGLGPSLSWAASIPLAGSDNDQGILAFDWGVNASLLFGRQNARISHHTTGDSHKNNTLGKYRHDHHYVNTAVTERTRSVTVPNVGGSAGLSLKFPNAKVSIGYRADFFFGALDGGIDARKSENRGFFGPYASISIGLGD